VAFNVSTPSPVGVYDYELEASKNGAVINGTLIYVQFPNASLVEVFLPNMTETDLFTSNGSNIYLVLQPNRPQSLIAQGTVWPNGMETCYNVTRSATVAGVPTAIAFTGCTTFPFKPATSLPLSLEALQWQVVMGMSFGAPYAFEKVGEARTPLGTADVYMGNITYNGTVLRSYTAYVVNGVVYLYNATVIGSYSMSLKLKSISPINETYVELARELSKPLPVTNEGGLSLVQAAEKVGVVVSYGQPVVLAFMGADITSATLFFTEYPSLLRHGLILLDAPNDPIGVHCINTAYLYPQLDQLYKDIIGGEKVAPNCSYDLEDERLLFQVAAGPATSASPVVVVVYPNGSFVVVAGLNTKAIDNALGG
jgi:hypothetical protein